MQFAHEKEGYRCLYMLCGLGNLDCACCIWYVEHDACAKFIDTLVVELLAMQTLMTGVQYIAMRVPPCNLSPYMQ